MAKQKLTVKLKEPVRIRFKQLSNGNQSIYLEYYTGDVIRKENYVGGKRKYEFLKLYLIPERTRQMPKASKYGVLKTGGRLSNNSVVSYYGTLRTAINRAYKEGIITVNPTKEFDFASKVRQEPSRREYLTLDELKTLINTECRHEIVKRAFLFSCLCGLRVSDIRKLRWCDLQRSGGRVRIEITMQKTKEPLYLPISDEALKWLPERGEANDSDFIFPLTHEGTVNDTLQHWAKVAGITKHISFHVARHTHATMMLTLGADLYTVSKLLGHKNIATTQIYAKIVDKKKEEAIGLIPNLTD